MIDSIRREIEYPDNIYRIVSTIESCETILHMETALTMIENYTDQLTLHNGIIAEDRRRILLGIWRKKREGLGYIVSEE